MRLGSIELNPPVIAAPMAGITDQSFRIIARELGATLVITEMVSCKGLIYNQAKTWELLATDEREQPIAVQLFGSVPDEVARAACLIEEKVPCVSIDINMGCPTPKITKNGEGAALLLNPRLAGEIVRSTVKAVSLPITVKTRKSWDDFSPTAIELAKEVEQAGAAAITVHGRTRAAFYGGKADWDIIRRVRETVSIPVIGNGDVFSGFDALRLMAETGCHGIMVGRGALGNPWLYRDAYRALLGLPALPAPTIQERLQLATRQLTMTIERKGEYTAIREMRQHLAWYIRGVPGAARWRDLINKTSSPEDLRVILSKIADSSQLPAD
ncbi:MAG TPA: tRNA dihydrouridine synthase DusB [Bacillota bacterium]|nr:tRNA dihydrouridine synthase DusB [Bacillota bacterium]